MSSWLISMPYHLVLEAMLPYDIKYELCSSLVCIFKVDRVEDPILHLGKKICQFEPFHVIMLALCVHGIGVVILDLTQQRRQVCEVIIAHFFVRVTCQSSKIIIVEDNDLIISSLLNVQFKEITALCHRIFKSCHSTLNSLLGPTSMCTNDFKWTVLDKKASVNLIFSLSARAKRL